jgi:pyruvate dehydrogenase E1 component beta subunit
VADACFNWLDAPIKTVTAPNTPVPFAAVLEAEYVPNANRIVAAVQAQIG